MRPTEQAPETGIHNLLSSEPIPRDRFIKSALIGIGGVSLALRGQNPTNNSFIKKLAYPFIAAGLFLKEGDEAGEISRRDFLGKLVRGVALTSGAALLAGCTSEYEQTPEFDIESQSLLDSPETLAMLENQVGQEWRETLAKSLIDVAPSPEGLTTPEDEPSRGIATALSAAYLAENLNRSIQSPELLSKVRLVSEANGNSEFYKVLQAANLVDGRTMPESLVRFYLEGTKGGYVVFDKQNGIWWKFVQQDYNSIAGKENIVADIWRNNLSNFDAASAAEIQLKSVNLNGSTYTVLRTPQVGRGSLSKLMSAGIIDANTASLHVQSYFRQSLSLINQGEISAVHLDPHLGNLTITNTGKIAPIDFDRKPFAFGNNQEAAKIYLQKMEEYYSNAENKSGVGIDRQTLRNIFTETVGIDPQTIPAPQRYKGDVLDIYTARTPDAAQKAARAFEQYTNGDLSPDFVWASSELPYSEFKKSGLLKHLPDIFEKIKPVARVGAKVLDAVAIYYTIKDVIKMVQGNTGWLYNTENNWSSQFTMNTNYLDDYLDREIQNLAYSYVKTHETNNSPISKAIRATEKQLGISIPPEVGVNATTTFFIKEIAKILEGVEIVRPLNVFSSSGIPTFYGEENHNMVIVSKGNTKATDTSNNHITMATMNAAGRISPKLVFRNTPQGLELKECLSDEPFTIKDYSGNIAPLTANCKDITIQDGILEIDFRR